jgi:hypothetical protein
VRSMYSWTVPVTDVPWLISPSFGRGSREIITVISWGEQFGQEKHFIAALWVFCPTEALLFLSLEERNWKLEGRDSLGRLD